jgi:hypothetical protein
MAALLEEVKTIVQRGTKNNDYPIDIIDRVYPSVNMNNIGILKTAYDMNYSLDLSDMSEELVSEALTL